MLLPEPSTASSMAELPSILTERDVGRRELLVIAPPCREARHVDGKALVVPYGLSPERAAKLDRWARACIYRFLVADRLSPPATWVPQPAAARTTVTQSVRRSLISQTIFFIGRLRLSVTRSQRALHESDSLGRRCRGSLPNQPPASPNLSPRPGSVHWPSGPGRTPQQTGASRLEPLCWQDDDVAPSTGPITEAEVVTGVNHGKSARRHEGRHTCDHHYRSGKEHHAEGAFQQLPASAMRSEKFEMALLRTPPM
jgi:hypothetical protein